MDAKPLLATVARALQEHGLEAVLIGNAAAALRGAPVTTLDFDFFFRKTPANLRKLKAVADELRASILRPYYPVSDLFRLVRDEDLLQVDFMGTIHGARSFASLRSRASSIRVDDYDILVADLSDIIRSKRSAARPRDRAVLDVLERTLSEQEVSKNPKARRPESGE
jgi:predicted nucleotidyltransferase